ncbi:hypothetical protein CsSME_00039867 [Camellia sinensis var. sinensis]
MESRLAATARVSFRAFSGSVSRHQFLPRGLATAFIPTRHIADPAIHSSEASDVSVMIKDLFMVRRPSQLVELLTLPFTPKLMKGVMQRKP